MYKQLAVSIDRLIAACTVSIPKSSSCMCHLFLGPPKKHHTVAICSERRLLAEWVCHLSLSARLLLPEQPDMSCWESLILYVPSSAVARPSYNRKSEMEQESLERKLSGNLEAS